MGFTRTETFFPSGKADKATGLEENEQHYWLWKFWQHNTLIFCFIISNLRLCHWCTQLPTHFFSLRCPLEPHGSSEFGWQTYAIPHIPEGERKVQVMSANGSPWLPPGCHQPAFLRLEMSIPVYERPPSQVTHALSVRLTQGLSWGMLSEEKRKGYEKNLITNGISLTWELPSNLKEWVHPMWWCKNISKL